MPKINAAGLAILENAEGLRLEAYQDSTGVWTIGYGHTGNVVQGNTVSKEQAQELLQADLAATEEGVNDLCVIPLNSNQFSALVDFAYNLGVGALAGSTLMRLVNAGNFKEAAAQFGQWVWAGGQVLPGLVTRRAAERKLFETPT